MARGLKTASIPIGAQVRSRTRHSPEIRSKGVERDRVPFPGVWGVSPNLPNLPPGMGDKGVEQELFCGRHQQAWEQPVLWGVSQRQSGRWPPPRGAC